jgi:hypothetical protein
VSVAEAVSAARAAHERVLRGELDEAGRVLRALDAISDPIALAWSYTLRAEIELVSPRYGRSLEPSDFDALGSGPPLARAALAFGACASVLTHVLAFDGDRAWELAVRAVALEGLDREGQLHAELAMAWATLARGDADSAANSAEKIARQAQSDSLARLAVEARAVRALATTNTDPAASLDLARRTSLMARSEGLPAPEFLAHLVLARARRSVRQSHLAARVLTALAELAPPPWQPWIAWEQAFATGSVNAESEHLSVALSSLSQLMQSAANGDVERHATVRRSLETAARTFFPAKRDVDELVAAMDPTRPAVTSELAAWRAGESMLLPANLAGFRGRAHEDEENAAAYVLTLPGERGRRVLHLASELIRLPGLVRIAESYRAQGRVETLLCVLALAGPDGLDEGDCFTRVYEFEFVHARHRGAFDVLVHRTRAALEQGRIERSDRALRLALDAPLLVPDPRASQRITDRILRLLAERGSASARDAAESLGISLRSAQGALAELSEGGACDPRRVGKNLQYVVEDSIFSEPTRKLLTDGLTGLTRP